MTTETRRILNIAGPVASLNNGQKGIETTTDTDTGVKSYVYKDYSGGEHKLLTTESPINKIQGIDTPTVSTTETRENIEVVTNGSLDEWTGDNPDSWTVSTEDGTNYITESNGQARIVSDGSTITMTQAPLVSGRTYRVAFTVTSYTTGTLRGGGTGAGEYVDVVAIGDYTLDFTASSTSLQFGAVGATDLIFNNVSCKEIAIVANNNKRLELETSANFVLQSENYDSATWYKEKLASKTDTDVFTNCGTVEMQGMVGSVAFAQHYTTQPVTVTEGANVFSVEVRQGARQWIRIEDTVSTAKTYLDIGNIVKGTAYSPLVKSRMTPHSNGNVTVEMEFTASTTSAIFKVWVTPGDVSLSYSGDGSTPDVYVSKFQVYPGTLADSAKYIATTTTTESGVSNYLWSDNTSKRERAGFLKIANSESWGIIETGVEYEAQDSIQPLGFGNKVYCQYVNETTFTTGSYQSLLTGIEGATSLKPVNASALRYRVSTTWYSSINDSSATTVVLLKNSGNTIIQASVGSDLGTEFEGLIYYTKN